MSYECRETINVEVLDVSFYLELPLRIAERKQAKLDSIWESLLLLKNKLMLMHPSSFGTYDDFHQSLKKQIEDFTSEYISHKHISDYLIHKMCEWDCCESLQNNHNFQSIRDYLVFITSPKYTLEEVKDLERVCNRRINDLVRLGKRMEN